MVRGALVQTQINLRDLRLRQRFGPGVRHDSDDRNPRRAWPIPPQAFADGAFVSPVGPREGLVDHRDLRGLVVVELVEQAAAQQRDAQQAEIVRRHHPTVDHRGLVGLHVSSFEREKKPPGEQVQLPLARVQRNGAAVPNGDFFDSGQRAGPAQQFA